ncbi:MAG TPA: dephospho-CoA kinase [Geminicoccaceae bacterium]|nr:dephospho-CoA kinase [Geminicoccaceae bacterium]
MIVLGLTGGIAMGKSRAAAMFRAHGVPVFDADAEVHALMAPGGAATAPVGAAFAACLGPDGGVDRGALGRRVLGDPPALRRLEAIVHPLVRAGEGRFLRRACRAGVPLAVLDIPLLFETGGETRVDAVAVVFASPLLQAQRALRRPGMTPEKLGRILAQQVPDAERRKRADFVLPSGYDAAGMLAAGIGEVIRAALARPARAWPARWLRHGGRLDAA